MALCPKCERVLPSNGNCLYCGRFDADGAYKKGGAGRLEALIKQWLVRILLFGGIAGAGYWLVYMPDGIRFRRWVGSLVVSEPKAPDSPWVQLIVKYPKAKALVDQGPLKWRVIEESLAGDGDAKLVTIISKDGTTRYTFLVNTQSQHVSAQDAAARGLMN